MRGQPHDQTNTQGEKTQLTAAINTLHSNRHNPAALPIEKITFYSFIYFSGSVLCRQDQDLLPITDFPSEVAGEPPTCVFGVSSYVGYEGTPSADG